MLKVNIEEVADQLKSLLERVAQGEEVVFVEQGREVARLVPASPREQWLSRTRHFRESVRVQGEALSATVIGARQEERS